MTPAELIAILQRFFTSDEAGKRRILERNPELLSDEVETALDNLANFARQDGDEESALLFTNIGEALAQLRVTKPWTTVGQSDRAAATDELNAIVQGAVRAVGLYQEDGSLSRLDEARAAWEHLFSHPGFERAPLDFKLNTWNDAAVTHIAGFRATGALQDLDAALEYLEQAIAATPDGAAGLPDRLSNLGAVLSSRYDHISRLDDLERAVELYSRALALSPPGAPNIAIYLNSLGVAFLKLYHRTGKLDDLDRSMDALERALAGAQEPGSGADLPLVLQNLASTLRARFARSGDASELERACASLEEGITLLPTLAPNRMLLLQNLGNGLKELFEITEQLAHLDRAVEVLEEAMAASDSESTYFSGQVGSLAVALGARFTRTEDPEDLDRAMALSSLALEKLPDDSPLKAEYAFHRGVILSRAFEKTGTDSHYRQALKAYREAIRTGSATCTEFALRSARNLADAAFLNSDWAEAAKGYSQAHDLSSRLLEVNLARGQQEVWLRDTQNLGDRAAYALAKTGDLEAALVALDVYHARLIGTVLGEDCRDLQRLSSEHPGQVELLRSSADRWTLLSPPESMQPPGVPDLEWRATALRAVREEMDDTLADIRRIPGFERFHLPSDLNLIRKARASEPLVYVAVTTAGGLALVFAPDDRVTAVWLPMLTYENLIAQLFGGDGGDVDPDIYLTAYMLWREKPSDHRRQDKWFRALDRMTSWLWRVLVGPLLETLGPETHAVIVPSGALALLPIHAAWSEDPDRPSGRLYALDRLVFSFAPSARALNTSREIEKRVLPERLFAVCDPQPTEASQLEHASLETEAVAAAFEDAKVLAHEQATKEAVLSALPDYAVLHFACHGFAELLDPLSSGLIMAHSETLTLRDILSTGQIEQRLAVLSACETGIPGLRLPDEIVSLPSGLLGAGAAGVVGSLWIVPDLSTTMLMARFYDYWRSNGLPPPVALRDAQFWVRDSTNEEKAEYFESLEESAWGWRSITKLLRGLEANERTFCHPYYWAAFQYVGV